ncbi:uncharacterized protein LOC130685586 [Daphnia carinata]|uniref:uncharacterized protein LOC130685586 n=1 Tax=Daphnia carinata TaxID=120202 RepID=UPI00257EB7AC|nr:uncharacterized protein LOC130685586 [Daphnia carinata]
MCVGHNSASKMGRPRVSIHLLKIITAVLIAAVGCLANDPALDKSSDGPPSCPQEMCVFLFDRLEEQSIRLRNIEDALLRAVSILASAEDQEFSATSAALKSDTLLNSLLTADAYDSVDPIVLFSDQVSNSLESPVKGRKKRQIEKQQLSPKERLVEVLKWAKKSGPSTTRIPTADTMELLAGFKTPPPPIVKLEQGADLEHASDAAASVISRSVTGRASVFNTSSSNQRTTDALVVSTTSRSATPRITISPTANLRATSLPILTTAADISTSTARTTPTTVLPDMDQPATQRFVSEAVNDLQGAIKCVLAQLNSNNISEPTGILLDPEAILNENGTLSVQFELRSCQKYWQAVWIRISLRNEFTILRHTKSFKQMDSHLTVRIPKECLKKSGNVFSFNLPSSSKGPCSFPLASLVECKVYTIEIIPIYLTLLGQPSVVEITVLPRLTGNTTDLVSLEQVFTPSSTNILTLKWSVRSEDCAQLMTSVNLRIYEDESDSLLRSLIVPSDCIENAYKNSFSTTLSFFGNETNSNSCRSIVWEPLDMCQKYKLEIEPEYAYLQKGSSSSLEIFTSGVVGFICCNILTSASGTLRSVDYDGCYGGSTWLIVVEKNATIWLTFDAYLIESHYRLKVYDGPYSTSPVLVEHSGFQPPHSMRSRSNKLFIQLIPQHQYYNYPQGKLFTAHYISVKNTGTPFVAGCGGYIHKNAREIFKPAYPPIDRSTSECMWYIESVASTSSTLITSASGGIIPFPIIVYDGWSENGALVYNGSSRASVYSYGRKTLVKFPAWNSLEREREYSWNILNMSPMEECSDNLTSPSDTFSSHKDNTDWYSSLMDCRWTIRVDNSSQIRLTFVYFDIKRDHDFVTIYDGPTLNSSLLVELSGRKSKPVSFTSKSNQLLVRFTTNAVSNDAVKHKGFLAFYTTVPCEAEGHNIIDTMENVLAKPPGELESVNQHKPPTSSTTEAWNNISQTQNSFTTLKWRGTRRRR